MPGSVRRGWGLAWVGPREVRELSGCSFLWIMVLQHTSNFSRGAKEILTGACPHWAGIMVGEGGSLNNETPDQVKVLVLPSGGSLEVLAAPESHQGLLSPGCSCPLRLSILYVSDPQLLSPATHSALLWPH